MLGQKLKGFGTSSACDHSETAILERLDIEILPKAMDGDGCRKLGDAVFLAGNTDIGL